MTHSKLPLLCLTLTLVAACVGVIDDPGARPEGSPNTDPGNALIPGADIRCDERPLVEQDVRRLTRQELANTLRDLVGDAAYEHGELSFGSFPTDTVGAGATEGFSPLHSAAHVDALIATADVVAGAYLEDGESAAAQGHACVTEAAPDASCIRAFVTDFGRRAFRRPMTEEMTAEYIADIETAPTPREGLRMAMIRMLAAPDLMFHLEIEGQQEGRTLVLDHYAVASRISYAVIGSMPTEALFDAAADEALGTVSEVESWVRELLEDPRAEAHFTHFIESWLMVEELNEASVDVASRAGLRQSQLRSAMVEELELFASKHFFEGADYATLMTSPTTFAEDPRVAQIYDVAAYVPGETPPETGSERGGILLRAAMLLTDTNTTAPILRGVKVRRQILCERLPTPSNDIVNSRLDSIEDLPASEHSAREIIDDMTGDEPCNSCHSNINPIAYALEEFDQIGRFRTHEEVWEDDRLVAEHPIAPGGDVRIDGADPVHVESAMELINAIAESDRGHACFAQRLFEHVHLREPDVGDGCQVSDVYEGLREGRTSMLDAFVATVAQEAVLTRALTEEL